jgi:hypothetical protein
LRSIALAVTVMAGGQMKLEAAQQVHAHAREEKKRLARIRRAVYRA